MSDDLDNPIGPAGDRRAKDDRLGRAIEFRALPMAIRTEGQPGFSGLANRAWVVDSYGTAFAPGAWAGTIAERQDRIRVLWQHDPDRPIGRPTVLQDTPEGLYVEANITESTQTGREAMALAREGIVTGLSVGFKTVEERNATEDDPLDLSQAPESLRGDHTKAYVIQRAKLYEFSPVTFPSNEQSFMAGVRRSSKCDALELVLADLKDGRLTRAERQFLDDLVTAWREASERNQAPPRRAKASRRIDLELACLVAQFPELRTA